MENIPMKKSGLFTTVGAVLGAVEQAVEGANSYSVNWVESRELELAKSRFQRDIEWMKLGETISSTEFNSEAIKLAKERYLK